jgi:hypothetical protein
MLTFFMFYFLKKSWNMAMAHFEECGHVSQSTLSSLTGWLVNVKNTGKLLFRGKSVILK